MLRKISFIAVNIFSSGILFTKLLLFLKYLPDKDLGAIMLFQAVISLLGLAQVGLFNGGLRIFSIDNEKNNFKTTNNSIFTYVIIITFLLVSGALLFSFFFEFDLIIFLIASLTGGFSLLKNWFSNLLIARKKLKEINILNFCSAIVSAALAFTIFYWGVIGAIISIGSMYVVFVVLFFILQREYVPSKIQLDITIIKKMLSFGFIPYLSGIAVLLNNQIDRFFIAQAISLEALGQFYLATTFITIFNLFPVNLNSLFMPSGVNNYTNRNLKQTINSAKNYFFILTLYAFLSTSVLFLFGELIIGAIFPDKIEQLKFLFIMIPGIIALLLSKPFSYVLYISLNLKALLWSNLVSLFSYVSILVFLLIISNFTIENVAYAKSFQGILVLVFLLIITFSSWRKIKSFEYISENKYSKNV